LVPGAHEGRGLGNKFLDDLRHADALIHVVDVSGTTDAEGKNMPWIFEPDWCNLLEYIDSRQERRLEATTPHRISYGSDRRSYTGFKET
jgi:hypothetical protein